MRDVLTEDLKTRTRDYRTILTFMTRMSKKGWLEVEKEGDTNYYTPSVPKKEALVEEARRFFDDVVGPEPEDRELLKRILSERD